MRIRVVTSGIAASAAVAVLGLAAPALAAGDGTSGGTGATLETLEGTTQTTAAEDDAGVTQVLDGVDGTADAAESVADETSSSGPEPVADAVDETTDAVTSTTDGVTDALDEAVGGPGDVQDPVGDPDPDDDDPARRDSRGAGDAPVPAPAPGDPSGTTGAPSGQLVTDGGPRTSGPAGIALDGFRRTPAAQEVAVTEDALFEPEPMFAPPTTREVVEPTVAAAPVPPLRTVATEILVATALLVLASGALLAELGPERA